MVSEWEDLLREWDIMASPGCMPRDRCILLCDGLHASDGNLKIVMQLCPEGVSSEQTIKDFMKFSGDKQFQEITLLWEHDAAPPPGKFFILDALEPWGQHPFDYVVDRLSKVLPLHEKPEGPLRCLELFAGGVGGWSQGYEFL